MGRDEGGGVARMGPTDARRSIVAARGTRRNDNLQGYRMG